jgi:hypothetical protein
VSVAAFPPASLAVQLAELKREKAMRAGVYPAWVQNRKLTQRAADYQMNGLDGAIATLERLAAARERGEPGRQELVEMLRLALPFIKTADGSLTAALTLAGKIEAALAKVPA